MVEKSLTQKVNKVKVNIITCYVTYGVSYNLNPENLGIGGIY